MSASSAQCLTAVLVLLAHLLGATVLQAGVVAGAADRDVGERTIPGGFHATPCGTVDVEDRVRDEAVKSSSAVDFGKWLGPVVSKAVSAPVFKSHLSLIAMPSARQVAHVDRSITLPALHLRSLAFVQILT